jgi:IG-like fold at C-terminal of FixG, putative oxidoreductase
VLLVLLFYASGLAVALSMRRSVLVRVSPDRSTMYTVAGGRVRNKFRYDIANRGRQTSTVEFAAPDLAGAELAMRPVVLGPGESARGEFDISVPVGRQAELVTHFTLVAGGEKIPMTFLAPMEAK